VENVPATPGAEMLAVLLPVPLEVTVALFPVKAPCVDRTHVLWVRVDVRFSWTPVNTPWLGLNLLIVLVPRLAPLLLVALPPSVSVTLAELLKLDVELLMTRAFAGKGESARIPNAKDIF